MYHGVYEGAAAAAQPRKMLILGESHHDTDLSTQEVVEDYLKRDHIRFFREIACSFGIDAGKDKGKERALLWDKVFFGNYVDVSLDGPSGEGDKTAGRLIAANRDRYNRDLAEFLRARGIGTVFCFSFRVFDKGLPAAPASFEDVVKEVNGHRINPWCGRAYGPDSLFGQRVEVYGIPHPRSWIGFGAEDIAEYLKPVFARCCG